MAKKISTKEKWKNIMMYISAINDQIEHHGLSDEEIKKLEQDRLDWLMRNYTITWNQKTLKEMRKKKLFKLS